MQCVVVIAGLHFSLLPNATKEERTKRNDKTRQEKDSLALRPAFLIRPAPSCVRYFCTISSAASGDGLTSPCGVVAEAATSAL